MSALGCARFRTVLASLGLSQNEVEMKRRRESAGRVIAGIDAVEGVPVFPVRDPVLHRSAPSKYGRQFYTTVESRSQPGAGTFRNLAGNVTYMSQDGRWHTGEDDSWYESWPEDGHETPCVRTVMVTPVASRAQLALTSTQLGYGSTAPATLPAVGHAL